MGFLPNNLKNPNDPADDALPSTPSDTVDCPSSQGRAPRGFDIGDTSGGKDIAVIMLNDDTNTPRTFSNRIQGAWYPYRIKRVMSTGTTCQGITLLY